MLLSPLIKGTSEAGGVRYVNLTFHVNLFCLMDDKKVIADILAAGFCLSLSAQTHKPNIVFILADDLGWTDLSCTGSDFYETPNIDKLRASGMLFTQAYSNAANSAPSRASILTGLYTPRHGVYTVSPPDRGKAENRKLIPQKNLDVLDTTLITFPEILQANGYRTIHIGKWHLGDDNNQTGPKTNGFDVNIAGTHIGTPYSYWYPFCNQASEPFQKPQIYKKAWFVSEEFLIFNQNYPL